MGLQSDQLRQLQDQPFGVGPADAGVGDGFAVDAAAHDLATGFQVALHHEALDQALEVRVLAAGVEDLLADAPLLVGVLAGVGVIGIHDQGHVA